jgi:tRNA modification GTPase
MELELDFGEEDVEFANREELRALVIDLLSRTRRLYDSFYYGNALKQGFQLVLAGRPNAGKSTLFNALLNEDRAIVSDIAGTTRDSIEDRLLVDGISVRLVDTAGIREATDTIERLGIARTMDRVSKSGATLYVFDASTITPEDWLRDVSDLRSRTDQVWSVGNKLDLLDTSTTGLWEDYGFRNDLGSIHWISAVDGINTQEKTLSLIKELFLARFGEVGDQTTVTNLRHADALHRCIEDLELVLGGLDTGLSGDLMSFHIRGAIQALGSITGIIDVEEILGSIFSRFCIGK